MKTKKEVYKVCGQIVSKKTFENIRDNYTVSLEPQHTPTPWMTHLDSTNWHITGGQGYVASMMGNSQIDAANAALIVRVVNSHEALLKAARYVYGFRTRLSPSEIPMSAFDELKQAIAKAEGK